MVDRVSPFSSFSEFFKPIYSGIDAEDVHEGENFACLRECINLFDFGQRGFTLIPSGEDNALVLIEREGSDQSWSEIAWRVVRIATIIIPLIKLAGATIYFLANDFEVEVPQDVMERGVIEVPHVIVRGVKVKKAKLCILDSLTDDLVTRVLRHLWPACFQFAATTKQAYALMNADPLLGSFRIGRNILKQCFSLAKMPHINFEESDRRKLLKNFCIYDIEAAFDTVKSNEDWKCRVDELALISDSVAVIDEGKSFEILRYAYDEVWNVAVVATAAFEDMKDLWYETEPSKLYNYSKVSAGLIKYFVKTPDLDRTTRLIEHARREFQWEIQVRNPICRELEIYAGLGYLECREAFTMAEEKANIAENIARIRELFEVFPEDASFLVEDLLEFSDNFIAKFPQGILDRVILLLDLCEVLIKFDRKKACEIVIPLMKEIELIKFIEPKHHIQYVKVLLECGQDADEAIDQATKCIDDIEKDKPYPSSSLMHLCEVISHFNKKRVVDLIQEFEFKWKDKDYNRLEMALTAAKIFAASNKEITFKLLDFVFNPKAMEVLSNSNERFDPIYATVFKEIAKFYPLEAKEFVEGFEDSRFKLEALTAVVEGIIESVGSSLRSDKGTEV